MNRRSFLQLGTGAALASRRAWARTPAPQAPRPNIILILADDMGYSDIGCFGSEIATPNLDRLASRGIRMSQFYNNPRCCPSRASIMTGLYAQQAHMGDMVADHGRYPFPSYDGDLNPQTLTIPEALKTAGYNTAMVGKWHLTPENGESGKKNWPLQRGFDRFRGMIAGASVYYNSKALVQDNAHVPMPGGPDTYLTDLWAEHAADYVRDMAGQDKPFFLYCAFNAPHWPIQAPEDQIAKYTTRYRGGWDALREERHKKQIAQGLVDANWSLTARDPRVPAWTEAKDKDWEARRMAVYAAMIDRMDHGIGKILNELEASGKADNTLVIFLSDNGGNAEELQRQPNTPPGELRGNTPDILPGAPNTYASIGVPWGNCTNTPFRLYKHYTNEGGISTPFIACWPRGIQPSAKPVKAVGHETDLMPTFLELAGVTYPARVAAGPIAPLVGQSLVPVFSGRDRMRKPIFWEHEGNRAVRDGKWKLVSRFPNQWELYDMEADRTELHDLATLEPARVKTMAAMYDRWATYVGAQPWPMPQTPPGERTGEMPTPNYLRR